MVCSPCHIQSVLGLEERVHRPHEPLRIGISCVENVERLVLGWVGYDGRGVAVRTRRHAVGTFPSTSSDTGTCRTTSDFAGTCGPKDLS